MSKVAAVQQKTSLPVINKCPECHWFNRCGGYRDRSGLFANTCFDRHCCGGKVGCNYLCPSNARFATLLNEVDGLSWEFLPEFAQRRIALPEYIPSVLHHSSREGGLEIPFAAVPLNEVVRVRGKHMLAIARNAGELRNHLLLSQDTRILLNCIRPDNEIERLWEFWLQDDVPAQLLPLGIDLVIGPNFSHLRGVPRLEILGNRMRHLMCLRDFRNGGLNAVPHLSVLDPQDWDFWQNWLLKNPKVRYAAFEFETGYKTRVEGLDAITRMARVQDAIKRDIHLVVVGGTQYRDEIRGLFRKATFVDGGPFWNTTHRHRARLAAGQLAWESWPTQVGEPLDELLAHNCSVYTRWMDG